MAAISLMVSREIVDELHELDVKPREAADADSSASRLPPRRGFSGDRTPRSSNSAVPDGGVGLRTTGS